MPPAARRAAVPVAVEPPHNWRPPSGDRRGRSGAGDLRAASSSTDSRSWISQNKNSGDAWESSKARRSASGERALEERVEERLKFGWTCRVRLDHATTDAKPQVTGQLHRRIDEFGLPRPGTAFDHDGSSSSRAHLVKSTFNNGHLCVAASKGKGLQGHVTSPTRSESVVATSSKAAFGRGHVGTRLQDNPLKANTLSFCGISSVSAPTGHGI